jgi:two-component system chemotaxis response regulator CheY
MSIINLTELNVVLTEPSHVQSRIIGTWLTEIGIHSFTLCETGQQTLAQLHRQPAHLVISALYLADMTGTDLVYAIRDDAQLSDTPFMLISSETKPRYLDPVRQSGAVAILPKPFTKEQLQRALINTLDVLNPDALRFSNEDIDLATIKVLIVDDSLTSRGQIRRLVQHIGITRISEAENGQQALPLIQDDFFDLIISDYNMPEMDGAELLDYIRHHSGQSSVPVVMVTSEHDDQKLAGVVQAGVSGLCNKPINPKMFKELIEKLLMEYHNE